MNLVMIVELAAQYCISFTFLVGDKANFSMAIESDRIFAILQRLSMAMYYMTVGASSIVGAEAHAKVNSWTTFVFTSMHNCSI